MSVHKYKHKFSKYFEKNHNRRTSCVFPVIFTLALYDVGMYQERVRQKNSYHNLIWRA